MPILGDPHGKDTTYYVSNELIAHQHLAIAHAFAELDEEAQLAFLKTMRTRTDERRAGLREGPRPHDEKSFAWLHASLLYALREITETVNAVNALKTMMEKTPKPPSRMGFLR